VFHKEDRRRMMANRYVDDPKSQSFSGEEGVSPVRRVMTGRSAALWGCLVLVVGLGLKGYFVQADSEQLGWILRPTAALVEAISGVEFAHEPYIGLVSTEQDIAIVAACAGINFMVAAGWLAGLTGVLYARRRSDGWWILPASWMSAYLLTLGVNAVRITLAIASHRHGWEVTWLSADQLHRLQGVGVYLIGLVLFAYGINALLTRHSWSDIRNAGCGWKKVGKGVIAALLPMLCYFSVTLFIPLLNGAYRTSPKQFSEHVWMVLLVGGGIGLIGAVLVSVANRKGEYRQGQACRISEDF
jgi:exosortase K